MNLKCLGGHVSLGIDVGVERRPGWYPVEQLNAAQFNEPMALSRVETCRFGIEDDFTHGARAAESVTSLWHCNYSRENFTYLRTCGVKPFRRIHDEISALSLFHIRHLVCRNPCEFLCRHARTLENTGALDVFGRRYDHDGVAAPVTTRLK